MSNLPDGVTITDQAIVIAGRSQPLSEIIAAEAGEVEDAGRSLVLTVLALFGPIAGMVVATQTFLWPNLTGPGPHRLWFGLVVLLSSLIPAFLAIVLAQKWNKPWGVIVERPDSRGHARLWRARSRADAERLAIALNKKVGNT